jgi:TetR/AcrR family transcriptional regulator, regulator of cefoperazone and chloramphenicol sensitivity
MMEHGKRVQDPKLIEEAMRLFSFYGLEGAGIRQIAQAADRPMSTITYQFGGKHGLYLACAQHIVDTIVGKIAPIINQELPNGAIEARAQLALIACAMLDVMAHDDVASISRFITREQQEPTEAFDILYRGFMGPVLDRMVALFQIVAGDSQAHEAAQLRALTVMGQVEAVRLARAVVLRLNQWDDIGVTELAAIEAVILTNLSAMCDHIEDGRTN